MGKTTFRLEPWETRNGQRATHQFGWRGDSEDFGEVVVTYPVARQNLTVLVGAKGDRIPETWFEGFGEGKSPSLSLMKLRIGTTPVTVKRRGWALTKRGRALRFEHDGRKYTCVAVRRGKDYLVSHDGVRIKVASKGTGGRKHLTVDVDGTAEPVDISLAVIFSGVNRANLTLGGAIKSAVARFFDMLS
ncbi:hypothetical protein ACFXKG_27190 [Streptomyces sp. NPDC059255]|uniref:hypothetical protein n=1 Tax=Streptomyces sp. NPDC059255 TaxID=3346793 RepID=UPI0036C29A3B